jgi:hypothetical protein
MYDADIDPDDRVLTRYDDHSGLLDAKANVPAERILQQSGAGDTTLAGSGDWYGPCPSEPNSSDQQDRDLAPAAIHADDSKVGRLRIVDGHSRVRRLNRGGPDCPLKHRSQARR